MRSFFLDNHKAALPIITGEADSFFRMAGSWGNRLIQVFFNYDAESLDNRRSIIRSLKTEKPLLFRTGYRYFIQYLAAHMNNGELHALTSEVIDEFSNLFPVSDNASYRQRDNFMLSYWALKVYLMYGVSIQAISKERPEALLLQYIEILKNSFEKQMTFNPLQYTCGTLLSVLKNMKITNASVGERIYPDYRCKSSIYPRRRYDILELENYGHTVFIDNRIESNGVFIEDCYQVENYRNASRKRVLLVLKRDAFMTAYETALSCTSSFVPHTQLVPFKDFRKALKENKVLLGERRNDAEKNYLNYSLEYPCINLDPFSKDIYLKDESVYVLNLPNDLIKPVLDLTSRESDSSSSCSKECGIQTDWLTKMKDTGRMLAYLE